MKTLVASAKKSASAKKPALTTTAKKTASAVAKTASKKASRSSSKTPVEKPAPKTPSKQGKTPGKSLSIKPASKSATKPATKSVKASSQSAKDVKPAAPSLKKETKKSALPASDNNTGKASSKNATRQSDKAPVAASNKNSANLQSGGSLSSSKSEAGLKGKIEQPVVLKVREVATNTMKSTPSSASDSGLLTEEQILKMREEDYMNPAQLAFFKMRLQQLEKDLLKNADETTEHLRETVLVPDPADRATIEEEHALELRTRDRERKLLKKVQQSIASIDGGDYGWCEETGEPIGIPRLLARPTATLSLEAQQRRELKQKLYGD
jgi:DnaK suppressor protein